MPKNEDSEFELVLGNRQLLSVFFLVVVLLGVFFTMGYIVGRNSAPLTVAAERPSPRKEAAQVVTEPAAAQVEVSGAPASGAMEASSPDVASPPGLLEPHSGSTYLQVLATTRTEAELIAESLRKKEYAAHVAASPSPTLFRVLVGPFSDTAELSKNRDSLVAAGFQKPIVRTYR